MFGKKHTKEALLLISKPGELNPMFNKKHSEQTKALISERMSKHPLGVGIFDLDDNLILKFNNNSELAKDLNISRVTVGKYLKKGLYKNIYQFKVIQP
jgi:group I intron endonuclease